MCDGKMQVEKDKDTIFNPQKRMLRIRYFLIMVELHT